MSIERKDTTTKEEQKREDYTNKFVSLILSQSKDLLKHHSIAKKVEVTSDTDIELMSHYYAQRHFRGSIYNTSRLLGLPGASVFASMPLIGKLMKIADKYDRMNRQGLEKLDEKTKEYLGSNYKTDDERIRARTLELGINDLVARATVDSEDGSKIAITKEIVNNWANAWKPRISTLETPGQ